MNSELKIQTSTNDIHSLRELNNLISVLSYFNSSFTKLFGHGSVPASIYRLYSLEHQEQQQKKIWSGHLPSSPRIVLNFVSWWHSCLVQDIVDRPPFHEVSMSDKKWDTWVYAAVHQLIICNHFWLLNDKPMVGCVFAAMQEFTH